ncbi:hypothetical protein [Nocardioides sp.]|uniref:GH39 family glycosyl hydrolase n=1 Tax=Nocardioides sp. TaxID=35761 RepID=UPI0035633DA0
MKRFSRESGIERGIWSPFQSLLTAQVIGATLGLVFWVLIARVVDAHEIGVAAAAISTGTLLGLVTVLGIGTVLISDLPLHEPRRQRQLILRGLSVVMVSSGLGAGVVVAFGPLFTANLRETLTDPLGGALFVVGVFAAAWAVICDESSLGVKRASVQVHRNLLASSFRFPLTAVLLAVGLDDSRALQLCWVLPLVVSVPFALWRLGVLRPASGGPALPSLRADLLHFRALAFRNHALSLSLAAASQMVPVIAGITLASVANAEFAIAWLLASFVFLPPYLLAIALFAHGANVSTEDFRHSMQSTLPASLLLSSALVVGAWVFGEPVLLIFGGEYSTRSWLILALLVPAGLWMSVKDHLVALWRSQRRFGLATRLAVAALVLELTGALVGAIAYGATGLCVGWLSAMGVEAVLSVRWLREAFGGLRWQLPFRLPARGDTGGASAQVTGAVVVVAVVIAAGYWTATRADDAQPPSAGKPSTSTSPTTGSSESTGVACTKRAVPLIDLGVQAATGQRSQPLRSEAEVRRLVRLAEVAGAEVISTTASFRSMQPQPGLPYRFRAIDRVLDAAAAAGLEVRLKLMLMPKWAFDESNKTVRQPPRTEGELDRWATFVRTVMQHVRGRVDYVEVWNEPNSQKFWTTGPNPVEFMRLLETTNQVIKQVAPDVQVISGGLVGNDLGYFEQMYAAAETLGLSAMPFDQLGIHPFTGSSPPSEVDPAEIYERDPYGLFDANFTGYESLHDIATSHGDDDMPFFITQFGYSTKTSKTTTEVPDAVRAGYLAEAFDLASCAGYISGLAWYALHPTPWDPAGWTLLNAQLVPNQTYGALQDWADQNS